MRLFVGMLSIWKPNDAILELFKENSWIEIMNVVPTAIRYFYFKHLFLFLTEFKKGGSQYVGISFIIYFLYMFADLSKTPGPI